MDIDDIQSMRAYADGYKLHLEACGCTDVEVTLIPDDWIMEGYFRPPWPIKMVKGTFTIKPKK